MASVFTRIMDGELPSFKIFENEHVYALLALDQVRAGHTLVVPKIEVDHFFEVPEPYYSAVFAAAKPIAKAIRSALSAPRVGTAVVGFEVAHFHLHLIPMTKIADLNFANAQRLTDDRMRQLQSQIVGALGEANR